MENFLAKAITQSMPLTPTSARIDSCEETTWLDAARRGESWALERFYDTYQKQVHALCTRMMMRAEDAEDAMQATFVQAFRAISKFRGESSAKTWLYRIAMNQCVSMLRRRRDTKEVPEHLSIPDESEAVVDRLSVHSALRRVSPDNRAILALRYWEDMECDEIAGVFGITISAAKMRLFRARAEFRKYFEGDI